MGVGRIVGWFVIIVRMGVLLRELEDVEGVEDVLKGMGGGVVGLIGGGRLKMGK